MLKSIRVKNFKSLKDTGDIELRPLTFLVGPNSSGKSSLLQMFLILKQTIESTQPRDILCTNGKYIQMGSYNEFIYNHSSNRHLGIDFTIEIPRRYSRLVQDRRHQFKIEAFLEFGHNSRTNAIYIRNGLIINQNSSSLSLKWDSKPKTYTLTFEFKDKVDKNVRGTLRQIEPSSILDFAGYKGWNRIFEKSRHQIDRDIIEFIRVSQSSEVIFAGISYLGPYRESPKRIYFSGSGIQNSVGIKGEEAPIILWLSARDKAKTAKRMQDFVKKWFKKFEIGKDVRLIPISKDSNYFSFELDDYRTEIRSNLADVGFGASQVLPIIIEAFNAPPESMILIEQPEIHLHPKAQSDLGDLFVESINNNRIFVIETHSEHILSRVRRRIAEGTISKEQVAIYYFNPTKNGSSIMEVTLNKNGQYVNFPNGFFEEDLEEAFAHLEAIRNNNE